MKRDVLDAYKKAILKKFENEKVGLYSSHLIPPSRARLRQLCVERFKGNTTVNDLNTFKIFFGFDFDEKNLNKLKSETDKFRRIENFLKKKNDTNDISTLDMIAFLVDLTPRPFLKYGKNDGANYVLEVNVSIQKNKTKHQHSTITTENVKTITIPKIKRIQKAILVILGIAGSFSMGYTTKDLVFPEKQCMQWQKDHYELMDCNTEANNFYAASPIFQIDESVKDMRKISVTDTTTFFLEKKPLVWYCKVNGHPEYFNKPGIHPLTGKTLKVITPYMIDKYVKK